MTEATGKGNCMFAYKNTIKAPTAKSLSGLLGILLCLSIAHAQQDSDATEPEQNSEDGQHIERFGESTTDEWEMDLSLAMPAATTAGTDEHASLPDELQNQQLQQLLSNLAVDPDSARALAQIKVLMNDVLRQADDAMNAGSAEEAERFLAVVQSVDPGFSGLSAAQKRLKIVYEVGALITQGNVALDTDQILEPANNNALYYFRRALALDSGSQLAH
jgi:hypothetical protein